MISGNKGVGGQHWLLLAGVIVVLIGVLASPASAAKPKAKLTVAYGLADQSLTASGSIKQPGLRKKFLAANKAVLEEKVVSGSGKSRWIVRAKSSVPRKPGKSNRFRLKWVVPASRSNVIVRTRVLRGKKQVAVGNRRTFKTKSDEVPAPDVTVPTETEIASAPSPDQTGEMVLDSERDLASGDVIASGVTEETPDGFLGKVVSSEIRDGKTYAQTEPVSLMDAVPNGSFDISGTDLQPTEDMSSGEAALARAVTGGHAISARQLNGLLKAASDSGGGLNTGNKAAACGPSDAFKAEASLKGSLGTRFQMSWNTKLGVPVSVKSAVAQATLNLTQQVTLSSAVGVNCSKTFNLLPTAIRFAPIAFTVGPVPVVLVPELNLSLKLSGEVAVKATISVTSQTSITAGINYSNGKATPISSVTKNATADQEITKSATASATIGPKVGLKLYGVVGPAISVRAGITATATEGANPWLTVKGKIDTSAAVEFTVWKLTLSAGVDGPSVTWPILTVATEPNSPTDPDDPDDPDDPWVPTDPSNGDHLVASSVSAGDSSTCAVKASGQVVCWGENWHGELGDGTEINRSSPVAVPGLNDAKSVSVGAWSTCVVKLSGQVACWGQNTSGQLGDGTNIDSPVPVDVQGLTNVKSVSVGVSHACAVTTSNQPYCWGSNALGQLGDGTGANRSTPVAVQGLTNVRNVSAGSDHSCAAKMSGQVFCWGLNSKGQLGDGSNVVYRYAPVAVQGLSDARSVSADINWVGTPTSCAVKSSGSVVCWGGNFYGELGDGTTEDRSTPVAVSGLGDATAVSPGIGHTCAVKNSGQAVCWGLNDFGGVGDGTNTNRSVPVNVQGLGDAKMISAGGNHTCAIRLSGLVVCWGGNLFGQIGDGTTTNRTLIAPVLNGG